MKFTVVASSLVRDMNKDFFYYTSQIEAEITVFGTLEFEHQMP
jgi:hypothetical protein